MKIAHLILAHKNPKQLERLLNALAHPAFDFYIHIDKKTDAGPFIYLTNKKNVYLVKNRTKIYWAGYGTIQATLNGFREIIPKGYDYINVISAQDFPLKPADYIYRYIHDRQGKEFITCESIDDEWQEAAPRVKNYHLINWQIPGRHRLEKLVNKILPARKFPLEYKIVGRANWFTLTQDAAQYVLDFLDEHPKVVRYFKYCWGADEFIFATIIYNSQFRDNILDNLVHVIWYENKGHPEILVSKNFNELKESDKLFARKFDTDVDSTIVDLLENWIASANSRGNSQ
jgi:hypothetical protein